ncbi:MAG: 16S rRNA (guanine(527)-N(7))-methyltransferase RsmG [Clostridia bacterium]|nr:16S rRNA (guanine(527)-N(7))-methyltransferase RsmG [Clostridia bacterium]
MNCGGIGDRLKKNGIPFTAELPEKLEIYLNLLIEWNARMDLTAVPEEEEILDRHFADSLSILRTPVLLPERSMIDVGTGAGFPGMVLAMAREDMQVTLMDAQQKRLNFLHAVQEAAGVRNIRLLHARAEDAGRDRIHREQYDYAVARALAPLNVLCEYLLPFVKRGGYALCWKGPALAEEMEAGKRASQILGGTPEPPIRCPVEGRDWDHQILPIRKINKTPPSYPRKAGTPKARPLGET